MTLHLPPLRAVVEAAQKTDLNDPLHFAIPTLKELEAQVRRRSVGSTIADICLDLGITPSFCDGKTWSEILDILMHFGANLAEYFGVQRRRRETFQAERGPVPS